MAKLVFLKLKPDPVPPVIKSLEWPLMNLTNPLRLALMAFPVSAASLTPPQMPHIVFEYAFLLCPEHYFSLLSSTLPGCTHASVLSLLLPLILLANLYWVFAICQTFCQIYDIHFSECPHQPFKLNIALFLF